MDLWDFDWMVCRVGSIDNGKGGRFGCRVSNVVYVVWCVEVFFVLVVWGVVSIVNVY